MSHLPPAGREDAQVSRVFNEASASFRPGRKREKKNEERKQSNVCDREGLFA